MLQRNVSGYPLILPTLDPPLEIPNGGEIEFGELLAGFEPVEIPGQQPQPDEAGTRRTRRGTDQEKEAPPEGA